MKKILCILALACCLFVLSACGSESPDVVVKNYIEASKKYDQVKISECIEPGKSGTENELSELTSDTQPLLNVFKQYSEKITYKIKEISESGDTASVAVDFHYIDASKLIQDSISEYIQSALALSFSGEDISEEEMSQMLIDIIAENQKNLEVNFTDSTVSIPCIKVDGKWYVDNPSEDYANVMSSNMLSVLSDISDSFSDK